MLFISQTLERSEMYDQCTIGASLHHYYVNNGSHHQSQYIILMTLIK